MLYRRCRRRGRAGARHSAAGDQAPEAKRGFVLLPRRWVVERSFGWLARFRRLARDYERLPRTVKGLHFLVFVCLLLPKALAVSAGAGS